MSLSKEDFLVLVLNGKLAGFCAEDLDLSGINFGQNDYSGGWSGAGNFRRCNLSGSYFELSDLSGVSFTDCDLTNTNFEHCILRNTTFRDCQFVGTDFSTAEIGGAVFPGSFFKNLTLSEMDQGRHPLGVVNNGIWQPETEE